jgi:hypothetical protein
MSQNKTIIVCFGNCQAGQIAKYLETYLDQANYFVRAYSNFDNKHTTEEIIQAISLADIIIYQPLSHHYNKDLSAENIKKIAKVNAKLISFPYIYNEGVYSLETDGEKIIGTDTIIQLYEEGYSKNKIIQMRTDGKIDFKLKEKFTKSLNIMRDKEKNLDIKIVDFIELNYKEHQLFLSHNHPTNIIFNEIFIQLMTILQIPYNITQLIAPLCETVAPITIHDKNAHGYQWNPYRYHHTHASKIIIDLIIYKYELEKNSIYLE